MTYSSMYAVVERRDRSFAWLSLRVSCEGLRKADKTAARVIGDAGGTDVMTHSSMYAVVKRLDKSFA